MVDQPRISRRDALRTVGATGALGAVGTTGASAQTSGPSTDQPGYEHGWTDLQTRELTPHGCTNRDVFTRHSLSYLNASWERLGAPAADVEQPVEGCWRHTFALTGVGASAVDGRYHAGLPYSALSVRVPENPEQHDHLDVTASTAAPTAAAVSARRSPSTFDFVDREVLEGHLRGYEAAPSDVASAADGEAIHGDLFTMQRASGDDPEATPSMGQSALSAAVGALPSALGGLPGAVGRTAKAGNLGVSALDAVAGYLSVLSVESEARLDQGFSAAFPHSALDESGDARMRGIDYDSDYEYDTCNQSSRLYHAAGGHYIVFDVFEVPTDDHVTVVDTVSAFDRSSEGLIGGPSAGWSIVLDTPVPDGGDPGTVSTDKRFSAEAVPGDASRRYTNWEVGY